jgi:hypothetical protein
MIDHATDPPHGVATTHYSLANRKRHTIPGTALNVVRSPLAAPGTVPNPRRGAGRDLSERASQGHAPPFQAGALSAACWVAALHTPNAQTSTVMADVDHPRRRVSASAWKPATWGVSFALGHQRLFEYYSPRSCAVSGGKRDSKSETCGRWTSTAGPGSPPSPSCELPTSCRAQMPSACTPNGCLVTRWRSMVDYDGVQVISATRPEWIFPFTGLQPAQFHKLVRLVAERGGDAIADGRPGRQWSLDLADRVLLVAAYWRTNLTIRQIGPLFGVSHSAAHRVIDTLGPLLALAPGRRRRVDQIAIVDGTLIPTRDHRLAAPSKNYRYSTNLQVAIGDPQPGNRNGTIVYRTSGIQQKLAGRPVMTDGAYRGNPEVIIPYRKPADGSELPDWKTDLNKQHRKVRAQVEHALARMKTFKILRDYRRATSTLTDTASDIANLHNIILAG